MHHIWHFIEGAFLVSAAIGVAGDEAVRFVVRKVRKHA